ncbi:MAG: hypothetical protein E6816_04485, partial [Citrobacter sp.]|nr:hypothetical protein [Citrobacter sp.]
SLYCSLTQYTHARGPILFGAGYVPTGRPSTSFLTVQTGKAG